jgi:flagellar hook-associated protein 3 FlgL
MEASSSSFLLTNKRIKDSITKASANVNAINNQIATGTKAQEYSQLPSQEITRLISVQNDLATVEAQNLNNKMLRHKLRAMEQAMHGVSDLLNEAINTVIKAKIPGIGEYVPLDTIAKQYLSQLESLLNQSYNGQFLFAGSKIDKMPVQGLVQSANLASSKESSALYYYGDSTIAQQAIAKNVIISYGITGDNKAFQDLIAGLSCAVSYASTKNSHSLNLAYEYLQKAKHGVENTTVLLASSSSALDSRISHDTAMEFSLQEKMSEIISVDHPQAMIALNRELTILNSVYMMAGATSRLSILDYLK